MMLASAALSALLAAAYARGAWPLAFVLLVPWIVALDGVRSARAALLAAIAMAAGFTVAAFGWFVPAIADYTGVPAIASWTLLALAGPLLQPQFLAFAVVRQLASRRHGPVLRAALAIAAWLAVEWAVPRLFGDTLGYGLQPAAWLRQGADLAGAAGLTLVALAANEAIATGLARRRAPWRVVVRPLAVAIGLPLLLAGYGAWRLATLPPASAGTALRIGLVQGAIVDYERLRREHGAHAVVRQVLDAHYALSTSLHREGAQALVWAETVYPTTFGQPRSPAGAEFDSELAAFVARTGVPLVFGTYERDGAGEYNVAAFVDPVRGPLGAYRKTRLFPLTEYVPPWLDGPVLRRWLPWAGAWRAGDGARVFPLVTADGREVPVAPLICRDDVDPGLARDGARLGAHLLVGLSNDSWFTRAPLGARLHLAAAAFRSIETRLPQVRATTSGLSAVVDATGEITARTAMGERTVLLADVHVGEPVVTPFVRWGQWLGPASWLVLALAGIAAVWPARGGPRTDEGGTHAADWVQRSHRALLLRPWQRAAIIALHALSRIAVLVLGTAALASDEPPRILAQLRDFAVWVLAPELTALALSHACTVRLRVMPDCLRLDGRRLHTEIDRSMLAAPRPWRCPLPRPGFDVVFGSGKRWSHGIAMHDAATAVRMLSANVGSQPRLHAPGPRTDSPLRDAEGARYAGASAHLRRSTPPVDSTLAAFDEAVVNGEVHGRMTRAAWLRRAFAIAPKRIDGPFMKFVLFSLVPAVPAFRLHQLIAYGSAFGEYHSFGAWAYLSAFLIWWASWAVTLALVAGGLRAVVEMGTAVALWFRPARTPAVRRVLLRVADAAYFIGVPGWLLARVLGG